MSGSDAAHLKLSFGKFSHTWLVQVVLNFKDIGVLSYCLQHFEMQNYNSLEKSLYPYLNVCNTLKSLKSSNTF